MSYFIFGLIDAAGTIEAGAVRAAASVQGLDAKLGEAVREPILAEMLGTYSPEKSLPFLLTRTLDEDTSDTLISPYAVGIEASAQAFTPIGQWLVEMLRSSGIERVRIWMTEGYDSSFEQVSVTADRFADEIARRVLANSDVPSLQVFVVK